LSFRITMKGLESLPPANLDRSLLSQLIRIEKRPRDPGAVQCAALGDGRGPPVPDLLTLPRALHDTGIIRHRLYSIRSSLLHGQCARLFRRWSFHCHLWLAV